MFINLSLIIIKFIQILKLNIQGEFYWTKIGYVVRGSEKENESSLVPL